MSTESNTLSCIPSNETLATDLVYQFYSLIYAVPTTILYFVVVAMIKRQSTYYSAIYVRLFSLYSYANLLAWWTSFLVSKVLSFWVICPYWLALSSKYWVSIPYYFLVTGSIASLVCSSIISIYQMYAIVYPTQCEALFKRRKRLIHGLIIIIPLVFCTHVLLSELRLWPLSPYRVYILLTHLYPGYDFLNTFFVNGLAGIISCVLIFFSSLISIVRYWKIRTKNNGEVKLRLFAINCYICFSTIVYSIYMLVQWYVRAVLVDNALNTAFYNYRSLLNDLCYLPIPWFVLLVNRRVRNTLGKIFGRKKITLVSTVPISSGNGKQ